MNWMAIAAVAVVTAFLAATLRRTHPEQAMAVTLVAGVLMVTSALVFLVPLLGKVERLLSASGLSGSYVQTLLKALGICLLTQLAADTCRDAGEQGLADKTELAGKLVLLTLALPLFENIGEMAVSLIEKG